MKRILLLFLAMMIGVFMGARGGWAERVYVTDSFEVPLRTGPSTGNKILALPMSGQALEVLETEGDWSHVRVVKPGGDGAEGWMPSRYLVSRLPWEVQAKSLMEENKELKKKVRDLELRWNKAKKMEEDFATKLNEKSDAFAKLQADYEALKQGASGYLKLKTKYDAIQSSLNTLRKQADRLSMENEKLRSSQRNRWFATGGLVLLCGMMIGLVVGRQQRKRRTSLYT